MKSAVNEPERPDKKDPAFARGGVVVYTTEWACREEGYAPQIGDLVLSNQVPS